MAAAKCESAANNFLIFFKPFLDVCEISGSLSHVAYRKVQHFFNFVKRSKTCQKVVQNLKCPPPPPGDLIKNLRYIPNPGAICEV